MLRFIPLTLLLALTPQVVAETSSQQLTITKAGYFLTVVDSSGVPQYVKLTNVVDLTSSIPPPDTPTPPTPPFDMELVEKVTSWAKAEESPQTAQGIAAVYSTVKGANLDAPWPVLKAATDAAILITESEADWVDFRKNLSAVITERAQRGTLDDKLVLASVQQGLEMSADGTVALPPDTITSIRNATQEIIDASR